MLKAKQIPWQAKEQLGRWLASGASHEECIAAVINAWPGMEIEMVFVEEDYLILPLSAENTND